MKEKIPNIKERILYLAEYQEGNKQTFFKKIGMSYGNFTGKSKMTPINSNALEEIILNYPDTNLKWLLTGEGEMINKPAQYDSYSELAYVEENPSSESSNRLGPAFTSRLITELEKIRNRPGYDLNRLCAEIDISRQSYLKWVKDQSGITRKNYQKILDAFPHVHEVVTSYAQTQVLDPKIKQAINQEIQKKIIEMPMKNMDNYKLVLTIEFMPISGTNLTPDSM